jgi:hypothetical protein
MKLITAKFVAMAGVIYVGVIIKIVILCVDVVGRRWM